MRVRRMKKAAVILVAILAAAGAYFLAREGTRALLQRNEDVTSQRALSQMASELNKTLPMMVDKETELISAVGLEGVIAYNYRLVNISADNIRPDEFVNAIRPHVTNAVYTDPQTRHTFLRKGVTMRYSYADKDRRHIARFDVRPADCGS